MHITRESKETRLPWEAPVIICRRVSTRLMTSVDGELFRRVALLVSLTQQRFRVILSFVSLLSLRLIILNHNHARSSRRSDRLRFIAGINVWHASQPYCVCQSRIPFASRYYYTAILPSAMCVLYIINNLFVRVLFIFVDLIKIKSR